jgi:hypothetical protein
MAVVFELLSVLVSVVFPIRAQIAPEPPSVSETMQVISLRRRWRTLPPSREHYRAHCSSVGEPRPSRKVSDGTVVPAPAE